jgi:hypothetical protein
MAGKVEGIPPYHSHSPLLDKEVKHMIDELKNMFQMQ